MSVNKVKIRNLKELKNMANNDYKVICPTGKLSMNRPILAKSLMNYSGNDIFERFEIGLYVYDEGI
jgi:hypothetical protein